MSEPAQTQTVPLEWYVAHTRPRCEKKVVEFCRREGFEALLPLYKSVKKYERKEVVFEKPLFPNYVFLRLLPVQRKKVLQNDLVANLLDVPDQQGLEEQLQNILLALETEYEVVSLPHITEGRKVKIKSGPLRGLEGFVQERQGKWIVLLRLDFISQAAGVRVDVADLELLD